MSFASGQDLADVTAAILAGGFGTRLNPVVSDRPKVLAEINGRPFLEYLLDQLVGVRIRQVVLCTGYLGQQVERVFGGNYRGSLRLAYSREAEPLGTGGALRLASPLFRSETVLVMNGDSYCHSDLQAFSDWHHSQRAAATLLLANVDDTNRFGSVEVGGDGRIISFAEKLGEHKPGYINAGVYLLTRGMLSNISPGLMVSLEREIFPRWVGRELYGFAGGRHFLDIGTPESYAAAGEFLTECSQL